MAKLDIKGQEILINGCRKNVKYETKEYTLEHIVSKFNLKFGENKETEIFIPFYQRKFVWKAQRQSKFIESILLGLPIPPMYFAEIENGFLEVIDGSQRIRTINRFLKNKLKLKGLSKLEGLNGLTFNEFSSSRRRKINNASIRAVVVTDLEKDTMGIRHEIFERLNTGGEMLKKMEIKKGAKEGKFIEFIYNECSEYSKFKELSNFNKIDTLRAYKEEFLVKYFAFVEDLNFTDHINDYLDSYIDRKNEEFEDDSMKDNKFLQFKTMLTFVEKYNLIIDINSDRKNRLLAIYIGTTLALLEIPSLLENENENVYNIFIEEFINNSKSNSFSKMKANIELVKSLIIEASNNE